MNAILKCVEDLISHCRKCDSCKPTNLLQDVLDEKILNISFETVSRRQSLIPCEGKKLREVLSQHCQQLSNPNEAGDIGKSELKCPTETFIKPQYDEISLLSLTTVSSDSDSEGDFPLPSIVTNLSEGGSVQDLGSESGVDISLTFEGISLDDTHEWCHETVASKETPNLSENVSHDTESSKSTFSNKCTLPTNSCSSSKNPTIPDSISDGYQPPLRETYRHSQPSRHSTHTTLPSRRSPSHSKSDKTHSHTTHASRRTPSQVKSDDKVHYRCTPASGTPSESSWSEFTERASSSTGDEKYVSDSVDCSSSTSTNRLITLFC